MARSTPAAAAVIVSAFGLAAIGPPAARAGTTTLQLGQQDFADGATQIYERQVRAAGKGEPFPFDGTVFGDDRTGAFGSLSYTHLFLPSKVAGPGAVIRSATLTIGVVDVDSPPGYPGTVALSLDDMPVATAMFTGISSPGEASSANVVSIPIPVDLLADGALRVQLQTVRHAPGFPGNSIEMDFSRLTLQTDPPAPPDDSTDGSGGNPGGSGGDNPSGSDGHTPGPGGDTPGGTPNAVPLPPAGYAGLAGLLAAAGCGLLRRGRRPA